MQNKIVKKLLKEQKVDALLITSDYNRLWYTTFSSTAGYLLVTKEKSFLILDGRYIEDGKMQAKNIDDIILMENIYEQLNQLIKKHNIITLGFESEYTSYALFTTWSEKLTVSLKAVLVNKIRMIKTKDEIKKLKQAAKIGDKTFKAIIKKVKPNMTEKRLERIIIDNFLKFGGEKPSFVCIVASGVRSSLPHGRATNKVINNNEIITCDFGVIYQGLCSDMTRTFVIGNKLDKKLEDIYKIVLEAQDLGIKAIAPGISSGTIDKICREYITKKGYGKYFTHSTGHGLGIEVHEYPYITNNSDIILEVGMVITVEPGIYIPQLGGVRIEDDILVTKKGYEILTKSSRDLIFVK
ncbi:MULTISPECIES: Xaa-Pro peptidase family protein [unclassified Spiroplasma]|uniref:M24 family metallopeptidase n=1 Tax=unclassified Spiroplasma TaxID=2637901 RepID=UPI00313EACA7